MAIYYAVAAVYGFIVWRYGRKRGQKTAGEMPVTHYRRKLIIPSATVVALAWFVIYCILV